MPRITSVIEVESIVMYLCLIVVFYAVYGGAAVRAIWFPLVYLLFVFPPPDTLFAALTQPLNAYHVTLEKKAESDATRVVWHTEEDGRPVDYDQEPAKSEWQRLKIHLFALLPLDSEL